MRARARSRLRRSLLGVLTTANAEGLYLQRLTASLARGALGRAARRLDEQDTATWEFSAFSQNGEDGVIEQLLTHVKEPTRYFVEIGASDGLENNSAYLAFVKKYCGVMVDGDGALVNLARTRLQAMNWGVAFVQQLVEPDGVASLLAECLQLKPDFLSVDIDGNDLHVTRALLEGGLRPAVVCVEYNSAFGPTASVTIPYARGFDYHHAHASGLYYGASVAGWRTMLGSFGYEFVTVESNGVNAFFIDPDLVSLDTDQLKRIDFAENFAQLQRFRAGWSKQGEQISQLPLVEVS